jgi:membrane fusion protein, multidrug efflux system
MSDSPITADPKLTETDRNGSRWSREFQSWQQRSRRRLSRRRVVVLGLVGLLLLAAVAYGVYWWQYAQTHVSTDDAFIAGHIAPVSARVAGMVVAVLVTDNQDVKAGDVLVRLDPRDYEVAQAQAQASVEAARGELENAAVNVPLADESTLSLLREADASLAAVGHGQEITEHDLEQRRGDVAAKQAAVAAARSAVDVAEADFNKARLDRDRMEELLTRQLVARQDFDHADATFKSAQAMLELARHKLVQAQDDARQAAAGLESQGATVAQARQRVAQSRAQVATAQSQRQQVKAREAQVEAARGRLQLALANLRQAQLNLDYATIRAPLTGRVTKKTVEVGQVLTPGQPLLSVVDLDDLWVVANFKETQLTNVLPGQRATVQVDTYPGAQFKARVDSVQGGSGAVFSLLPPENATGNYVKVVQRIPVKLVLERGENARRLLVPGMSVVPTIALR